MHSLLALFDWIPGIQPGAWLWISASGSISYWIKALWWQLGYSPIWLQGRAGLGTFSTIVRSLSWGHLCLFLGISLSPGFSLTPQWLSPSRYLFPCFPSLSLSRLNHPVPSCFHFPFPPLYQPPCLQFTQEISSHSASQGNPCVPLRVFLVQYLNAPSQEPWR